VHLQYLGHPIANDPLYSHDSIWGSDLGRGGVDLVPDDKAVSAEETLRARVKDEEAPAKRVVDLNDREYANIDAGSPIRLSQQARDVIAKLRRARDEQEDWVKWVVDVTDGGVGADCPGGKKSSSRPKLRKIKTRQSLDKLNRPRAKRRPRHLKRAKARLAR
jgi:predicted ATP-dependent endonuclease of OLD family